MFASFQKYLRERKYGTPIVIVSGLPRSGTSMMMKMLDGAGLPIMTDQIRQADVDNPKGYYEYERVKDLEKEKEAGQDRAWVREGRGKVLKVISFLLKSLPDENFYRIVFMRRDLDEVLASQNKMLVHRGEENPADDKTMTEAYLNHLAAVRIMVRKRPNMEIMEVFYDQAIANPRATAEAINTFLGGELNVGAMVSAIDAELYRNRKGKTV